MRKLFFLLGLTVLFAAGCHPMASKTPSPPEARYSDEELRRIAVDMQALADATKQQPSASSRFVRRLARLTKPHSVEDGLTLQYAAYVSKIAAVSATPTGDIRLSSALMDMMTDNELLFIIGHEIGHIYEKHCLAVLRQACATVEYAAAENAGADRDARLHRLFDVFVDARFTAAQEAAADAYARQFMTKYSYDVRSGVSALRKLEKLRATAGMPVTHMHSGDRARNLLEALQKR